MPANASAPFLLRFGLLVAGAGAVLYAAFVLVGFPQSSVVERAASRILAGDDYKDETLERLDPLIAAIEAAPVVRAASLRAAAVVTLRKAETAIQNGRRADIDIHMDTLAHMLPHALATMPGESFLWLALFWRDNTALGFNLVRLRILAMSYLTGRNEGWVAVKRSVIALALWPHLSPVLQEAAAGEFAGLVQSRFRQVVDILLGPGLAARAVLLSRLADIDERERKSFAQALYRAGVDLAVPGVDRPDARPWSK